MIISNNSFIVPSAHKTVRMAKISILNKKNSYESRVYESVDDRGLSCIVFPKIDGNKNLRH